MCVLSHSSRLFSPLITNNLIFFANLPLASRLANGQVKYPDRNSVSKFSQSAIRTLIRPSWCTGSATLVRVAKSVSLSTVSVYFFRVLQAFSYVWICNLCLFYFQFYDNQPQFGLDHRLTIPFCANCHSNLSNPLAPISIIYCFHHSVL